MRATLALVLVALTAGRSRRDVAARLAGAIGMTAGAWIGGCAFMLMEPLPGDGRRSAVAVRGEHLPAAASDPASYTRLRPLMTASAAAMPVAAPTGGRRHG